MHGRNAVEPNLKVALSERNHQLDELFEVKKLQMKKKPKKKSDDKDATPAEAPVDKNGYLTVERTGVRFHFVYLKNVFYCMFQPGYLQ